MKCDICSQDLDREEGFLLTTAQVVASPLYWRKVFESGPFAGVSNDDIKSSVAIRIAAQKTPWLVCDTCIDLFAVDTIAARQFALTFHKSGGTFIPPGSDSVPIVNLGDGKIFMHDPEFIRRLVGPAGQSNSSCFIATAAFSASAPEVEILRRFRDRALLQHPIGRRFVALYYRTSPGIAAWIEPSSLRRKVIRCALYPIILFAQRFGALRINSCPEAPTHSSRGRTSCRGPCSMREPRSI